MNKPKHTSTQRTNTEDTVIIVSAYTSYNPHDIPVSKGFNYNKLGVCLELCAGILCCILYLTIILVTFLLIIFNVFWWIEYTPHVNITSNTINISSYVPTYHPTEMPTVAPSYSPTIEIPQ
jgi:hypothetical protein